MLTKYMSTK